MIHVGRLGKWSYSYKLVGFYFLIRTFTTPDNGSIIYADAQIIDLQKLYFKTNRPNILVSSNQVLLPLC